MLSLRPALAAALFVSSAFGGSITQYGNRATFDAAVGPTTLEDFTPDNHFPISTGVLNSATNLPGIGITPGLIQAGVTYSAPINTGTNNEFNIDSGGGFSGGFLDTLLLGSGSRPITVTFDGPVRAFGFDTSNLGGSTKSIQINFSSGSPFLASLDLSAGGLLFFGFESDAQDIESVVLAYNSPNPFGAILDNFAFTETGLADVPEPSTLGLATAALALSALLRRR